MACEQVGFVDRPVGVACDGFGVMCDGPPEVGEELVGVVDGLGACPVPCWSFEEYCKGPSERLDVVVHVAERLPDERCDPAFAAEPRERRFHFAAFAFIGPAVHRISPSHFGYAQAGCGRGDV